MPLFVRPSHMESLSRVVDHGPITTRAFSAAMTFVNDSWSIWGPPDCLTVNRASVMLQYYARSIHLMIRGETIRAFSSPPSLRLFATQPNIFCTKAGKSYAEAVDNHLDQIDAVIRSPSISNGA